MLKDNQKRRHKFTERERERTRKYKRTERVKLENEVLIKKTKLKGSKWKAKAREQKNISKRN